jgi:hypothetical protein
MKDKKNSRQKEQNKKVVPPFAIKDCALIAIATGIRAQNLREMRDRLTTIHPGSIYYHFWGGLMATRLEEPEFNNDFASWSQHSLHDHVLAERLAVIDPTDFPDIEELRQELIEVIERRLDEVEMVPWAKTDQQFYFKRSKIIIFNTNKLIADPSMLPAIMPTLSRGSIFYHFIDARRRSPEKMDDFSTWLIDFGEGYASLRSEIGAVDLYFMTLAEIRQRLAQLCKDHLEKGRG